MRKGGDRRGSNRSRRARKLWMLATFDTDLGSERVRCRLKLSDQCVEVLDIGTITPDRLIPGGSYARGLIQPACRPCQSTQGGLARHGLLDHHYLLAQSRASSEADQARRFTEALERAK